MRTIACFLIAVFATSAFAADSWTDNVNKAQNGKWWKKNGVFQSKDKTVTFCVAEDKSRMLQMAIDKAVWEAADVLAKQFKADIKEVKIAIGPEISERHKEDDGIYTARVLVAVYTETLQNMEKK
ncbi:MAG: hypothetical protein Q8Q95_00790 [bacterium]|nr:hypothetical protein [bacterium]